MRLRSDLWHDVIHSTGQIFISVEQLQNDLTKYAISRGFDFTFTKNDSTRVTVHCKIATCAWSLHAIRVGLGPQFKIKILDNVHSCGGGLSTQKHPRASKKWEKIVDAPLYMPKDIKKDIFREYGVDLPYHQVWLGKEVAYKEQFGDERCSFNELLWYKDAVERTKSGSVVELDVTNEDNFAKYLRGKCSSTKDALIELLKKAVYVMTIVEFEKAMVEMGELCVQAELWAWKENPNYWANAFFQGERYGEIYSNPTESFNSWVLEARNLSILSMIDCIQTQIMALAYERRNMCLMWETTMCPKVDAYLKNLMDSTCGFVVNCSNGQLFEVLTRPSHIVDLQVGECTCREWQIRRLPCKHVCVVAHKIGCNVEEYCSLYFSTRCYQNCYVETIKPISNQDKPLVDFENVEIKPPPLREEPDDQRKK
ncbi:hypothetical protein Taro_007565 [Colocasia esculenta]|uniref:SWIM-type domain-containing protein n=1 Tax=Colocasia esculenta TaxID=4460 RepID=A0A843U4A7_COLES|nr:hypothetical protein [Colocasia esculenta]